ncbi:MAG: hypothetical protein ABJ005_10135, partial [Alloalcanivorax venustensis]
MNNSVPIVVVGCVLFAVGAWTLATQLSGGPEDYRARYASSPAAVESEAEQPPRPASGEQPVAPRP